MQHYVLGFMFSGNATDVVLVEKIKPAWQAGLYNGVGGKVEEGESAYIAMQREFLEETGVEHLHWNHLCCMQEEDVFKVDVYYTFSDKAYGAKTVEKEEVLILNLESDWQEIKEKSISNIPWLIMACLDRDCQSGRLKLMAEYK